MFFQSYELSVTEGLQNKIMSVLDELDSRPTPASATASSTNVEFRQDYLKNLAGNLCANHSTPEDYELIPLEAGRNETLDNELGMEWAKKLDNAEYEGMLAFRQKLPAFRHMKEVTDVIDQNQVCQKSRSHSFKF